MYHYTLISHKLSYKLSFNFSISYVTVTSTRSTIHVLSSIDSRIKSHPKLWLYHFFAYMCGVQPCEDSTLIVYNMEIGERNGSTLPGDLLENAFMISWRPIRNMITRWWTSTSNLNSIRSGETNRSRNKRRGYIGNYNGDIHSCLGTCWTERTNTQRQSRHL